MLDEYCERGDAVQFYLKDHTMFLHDFFSAGNHEFSIAIGRRNVESGIWYEAKWKTKNGVERYQFAQYHKLLWKRVIEQFLRDDVTPTAN
jgi:hypothetical protein